MRAASFVRLALVLGLLAAGPLRAQSPLRLVPCGDRDCVALSLEQGVAASLAGRNLSKEEWRTVLIVRTEAAAASVPPGPGLFGSHSLEGSDLLFRPRLPFLPETDYRAELDPAALRRLAAIRSRAPGKLIEFAFRIAAPALEAPRVLAVYPESEQVPGNLLRAYIEFSQPMRPDVVSRYLRLVDHEGEEVPMPFVEIEGGLWDPRGRRLTLIFHPGRLKRGVAPREELGPPLEAGQSFRLEIAAGWPATTGAALEEGVTREWVVTAEDRAAVIPASWRIHPPTAGSQDGLRVEFGEPLDHALALRMIEVLRGGDPVPGTISLSAEDREWIFTPAASWRDGEYRLRVLPTLEDLAGNNLRGAFDRGETESQDLAVAVELPFRPRAVEE
jgi:hypothetical protein